MAAILQFDPESHRYTVDGRNVISVTTVLKRAGLFDPSLYSPEAAIRGTYVHQACELDDRGELDEESLDQTLAGYLAGWRRFCDETRFQPELIEERVYSPTYQFAGTIDRVGLAGNRMVILDIKSGVPHPSHAIQLAGYQLAFRDATGRLVLNRWGVYLDPTGGYTIREFRDPKDTTVFQAALVVTKWKEENNV